MADGRAKNGGKRANAGRKSKAEELGLTDLLDRVWGLAEREAVIIALHRKARAGNEKAASLLLAYAYGKPKETLEHGGEIAHTHKVVRVPPKVSKEAWSELLPKK